MKNSGPIRYWGNLTERWGYGSYDYRDDLIGFRSIAEARTFMWFARRNSQMWVTPVTFCQCGGCDNWHTCTPHWRAVDIEESTAHMDLIPVNGCDPEIRLMYGPRGGIIRENF